MSSSHRGVRKGLKDDVALRKGEGEAPSAGGPEPRVQEKATQDDLKMALA